MASLSRELDRTSDPRQIQVIQREIQEQKEKFENLEAEYQRRR
jgi:hypothetical protein